MSLFDDPLHGDGGSNDSDNHSGLISDPFRDAASFHTLDLGGEGASSAMNSSSSQSQSQSQSQSESQPRSRANNESSRGSVVGETDDGGDSEVKQEDEESKRKQHEALHRQAVAHLRSLQDKSVDEEHGRAIFDRYDSSGDGVWSRADLRTFLFDLQEAYDCARVVPDEAVTAVVQEVQLNLESAGSVSWIEFKSYLIYLQQKPLDQLNGVVRRSIQQRTSDLTHAVIVTHLPAAVDESAIRSAFSSCGRLLGSFITEENGTQALLCFTDDESVANAVAKSGTKLLNHTIHVQAYDVKQDFPNTLYLRRPSKFARGLATVVIKTREFDQKHQISATVRVKKEHLSQQVGAFAEEHKIPEKFASVKAKTSETISDIDERLKISATVGQISDKYKLKEKAAVASAKARATQEQIMANKHVQAVSGYLGFWADRVRQSYSELSQDIDAVIAEHQEKTAQGPETNFEMDAQQQQQQQQQQRSSMPFFASLSRTTPAPTSSSASAAATNIHDDDL